MKKVYLIIIYFLIFNFYSIESKSQATAMAEVYSGYDITKYNMKGYNPTPFVPIGFRAGIGSYGIQFGADFWTNGMNPKFTFKDSTGKELYTEQIEDTYLGAMIRGYAGDDPKRLAVIFRIGTGVFFSKKATSFSDYYLIHYPNAVANENYKYKNSLGYNAALGLSIPIGLSGINFTIEGQFYYNPRKENNVKNYYTTYGVQGGLSFNILQIFDPDHYK